MFNSLIFILKNGDTFTITNTGYTKINGLIPMVESITSEEVINVKVGK